MNCLTAMLLIDATHHTVFAIHRSRDIDTELARCLRSAVSCLTIEQFRFYVQPIFECLFRNLSSTTSIDLKVCMALLACSVAVTFSQHTAQQVLLLDILSLALYHKLVGADCLDQVLPYLSCDALRISIVHCLVTAVLAIDDQARNTTPTKPVDGAVEQQHQEKVALAASIARVPSDYVSSARGSKLLEAIFAAACSLQPPSRLVHQSLAVLTKLRTSTLLSCIFHNSCHDLEPLLNTVAGWVHAVTKNVCATTQACAFHRDTFYWSLNVRHANSCWSTKQRPPMHRTSQRSSHKHLHYRPFRCYERCTSTCQVRKLIIAHRAVACATHICV
jgi:hypothetical protein